LLILFTVLISCSKKEEENQDQDSSQLGGDPNIALNTVGNTFTQSIAIYGSYVQIESSAEIIQSENGVNTLKIIADLSQSYELEQINAMIPAQFKDNQGRLNVEARAKATSEGILDYTNMDEKPFLAVRYDAEVGDTYKLRKSNGTTITRIVTYKSEVDDFFWGLMLIKVIKVVQDSRIPGICDITYVFNHKYGLVAVEICTEDDETITLFLFPQYPES